MATSERLEFGRVLDKGGSEAKRWLALLAGLAVVLGAIGWGVVQGSKSDDLERRARAAEQQVTELQGAVQERDRLLAEARADETIQRSPGASVAVFYGVNARAQESGVVFAHPAEHVARVYLYGLATPPAGQEYVVAARTERGEDKALGAVVPENDGGGFLLAKGVPNGTAAIVLALVPRGSATLDRAELRISARYPARDQRGVLTDAPARARRARR
jgi:hypothetical protein